MILDCDWSISAQLIPNKSAKICNSTKICNKSAKICNKSAKSVTKVQNFVTNVSDRHKFPPKYKFLCST